MSVDKIIGDWKNKRFKPLYWLEGEEAYYIDLVTDYAEHKILSESEASFNLSVFYGKDANWADVVNACMRYPMFGDKQVVLLKEAQQMKDLAKLEPYIENPLSSTIFVISHKEKPIDKRKAFAKSILKHGEILTSEKIRDYKLAEWLIGYLQSQQYSMSAKAIALITDHVGSDLSRIVNEIEKVTVNLAGRKNITEEDIEKYIGVSKDYNAFELQEALSKKDLVKAIKIIQYFEGNTKAGPIQLILPALYSHFSRLYVAFGMADKSENAMKALFNNNGFAAKEALVTMKRYQYDGVERCLLLLHEYNLKSIGINNGDASHTAMLKELVVKMMG